MENILINIGTKDEVAQQAIQYVNSVIVVDWIFMPLFILSVALDIFALVAIFSQDIDINSKIKESIPLIFIFFVLVFLVTGLGLELSHTYETRRDISNNADKAVEYYIDMKGFDRYD